jgi:hypothetical protein
MGRVKMGDIKYTSSFCFHPKHEGISAKLEKSLEFFPEIDEINIGVYGRGGGDACIAVACMQENSIDFNIRCAPTYNTIFHELGHHLQYRKKAPSGEKAATVFGLARLPVEMVDKNFLPYIGLAPRQLIPFYCGAAIEKRQGGTRNYIKWLQDRLESDRKKCPAWPVALDCNEKINDVEYYSDGKRVFARGFENVFRRDT